MTSVQRSPGITREVQAAAMEAAQGSPHISSPCGWAGDGWHAAQAWQGPGAQGLSINKSPGAVGTGPAGSPWRGCTGSQGAGGGTRPPAGSFCEAVGVPQQRGMEGSVHQTEPVLPFQKPQPKRKACYLPSGAAWAC